MCDGRHSGFAPIAQTEQPGSCSSSVLRAAEVEEEKSCTERATEHQDHLDVHRDELRNVELHVWLHLHTPSMWRRSTPNRAISSSCVDGGATLSTVEALGQLHPGTGGSKTALKKL